MRELTRGYLLENLVRHEVQEPVRVEARAVDGDGVLSRRTRLETLPGEIGSFFVLPRRG